MIQTFPWRYNPNPKSENSKRLPFSSRRMNKHWACLFHSLGCNHSSHKHLSRLRDSFMTQTLFKAFHFRYKYSSRLRMQFSFHVHAHSTYNAHTQHTPRHNTQHTQPSYTTHTQHTQHTAHNTHNAHSHDALTHALLHV